ncbi:MAG TPA: hypothetical protein VFF28_03660 [Candidatus Nanoarchaeia archaeon]|nr:hypothetical protein [Candidatus Nanoarchaeia archaeon]
MKEKISITIDEKSLFALRDNIRQQRHKSKSEAVEFCLRSLLEEF